MIVSIVAGKNWQKKTSQENGNRGLTVQRMKIQGTDLKKIFTNHIFSKNYYLEYMKNSKMSTFKKTQMIQVENM